MKGKRKKAVKTIKKSIKKRKNLPVSQFLIHRQRSNSRSFFIFILSRKVGSYYYAIATGYEGGGCFAEIFAKIRKTDGEATKGYYSDFLIWGDKKWQNEFEGGSVNESEIKIAAREKKLFKSIKGEVFEKYFFYDDEGSSDDIPYLTEAFKRKMKGRKFHATLEPLLFRDLSKHWCIHYRWADGRWGW